MAERPGQEPERTFWQSWEPAVSCLISRLVTAEMHTQDRHCRVQKAMGTATPHPETPPQEVPPAHLLTGLLQPQAELL